MKPLFFTIAISVMGLLTGCTKVVYTHSQVMERYKSKQDVVAEFGLPAEKRSGEGIEEWIYNYGAVSTTTTYGNQNTNNSVNGTASGGVNGNSNTNTAVVTQVNQYDRYVKFTFDTNGNVLKWGSQGINNEVRKKDTVGTVFSVAGIVALIAAFFTAAASIH
ncbi:MAG TPA: hypothetical protein VGN20_15880 [Mucilaginibacter sp.]|jgi:hypothetical protein